MTLRQYTGLREERGIAGDGRPYVHFYLVDDRTGADLLCVTGEDTGSLSDKRWTYKAVDALGGQVFESGEAGLEWVQFLLHQVPTPPVMAMRKEPPPKEKRVRSRSGLSHRGLQANQPGVVSSVPLHHEGVPVLDQSQGAAATCSHMSPRAGAPSTSDGSAIGTQQKQQQPLSRAASVSGADEAEDVPVEVQAAFQAHPALLAWVCATPNSNTVTLFHTWAQQLSGTVSNQPLDASNSGPAPRNWLHSSDAMRILVQIENWGNNVGLPLLEATGIAEPIAVLRNHPNRLVSTLADKIAARWRSTAAAALNCATAAMRSQPAGGLPESDQ